MQWDRNLNYGRMPPGMVGKRAVRILLECGLVTVRPQRSCGKVMFLQVSVILSPRPTPLPVMATAADGTHPTGMNSCFVKILSLNVSKSISR